jgi:hypothetical protein
MLIPELMFFKIEILLPGSSGEYIKYYRKRMNEIDLSIMGI